MARGKLGIITGAAVLGLFAVFTTVNPAVAQTVSDEEVGGVDNLAPGPVSYLELAIDQEAFSVSLSWILSDDDFVRQVPTGDLTSGGTFVNTNDVATYSVKRSDGGGDFVVVGEAEALSGEFTDDSPESGITYVYCVSAVDASDNESADVCSEEVSLGPAGEAEVETPEETEIVVQVILTFETEVDLEDEGEVETFIENIIALLARLLGIDPSRLANVQLTEGSVIVTFDILPEDGSVDAPTPAEAVAELKRVVAEEPEQFDSVGPVLNLENLNAGASGFGVVAPDEVVSESFTVANTSSDPKAILVVSIAVDGNGFSASTDRLSLASGESGSFDVSFSAADVNNLNGTYTGTLAIATNDANNGLTFINLNAAIEAGSDPGTISVPSAINFGPSTLGETKTRILTIGNSGDVDLEVGLELSAGGDVFAISSTSETVAGGGSVDVEVTYTPTEEVTSNGSITVTSNDLSNPETTVSLSGAGTTERGLFDDDGNVIQGDFDGSADVDFQDFFAFAENFGRVSGDVDFDATFDLDNLGSVDFQDFFIFAENFGKSGTYIGATGFGAILTGSQQVPPVVSSASGSGSFTLSADESELSFSVSFSGLGSAFTVAHIHAGAAGEGGSPVRGFDGATEIVLDGNGGGTINGIWNGASLADNLDALKSGGLYANIHSADNPSGEIRGQVIAQ
jgi:hypothetical protein